MPRVNIKPLSVNEVWQGKRFKTPAYSKYERDVLFMLPKIQVPNSELALTLRVGYSNKASDIDNCVKPFIDILQKKYGFNDSQIYELHVYKYVVAKGSEFIEFEFQTMLIN